MQVGADKIQNQVRIRFYVRPITVDRRLSRFLRGFTFERLIETLTSLFL
jgi:hypothetical protein